MAEVKNSGQNYRWPENLSEDFILPPKTNKSIQITAPPVKPSKSDSARSSQHDNPTPSYNGSTNLPSRPSSGSRTFPTRTVDQSGFLNEPPNKATLSVSEQASSAGIAGKPVVPSSITHLRPDDGLHHLLASRLAAESTLDIYASNYIPIWQTAINEAPASPRSCSPLGTIDYSAYISRFAGSRILSTVPPIRLPPIHSVPLRIDPSPGDLLPQWYGEYFSDALQNEITAHAKDLKTFSMYNVRFGIEDPIQYLYRFAIPGLREYSPRVDLGDVIRIRPLIAAPAHVQFTNRQRNLPPTPVFSGLEFHAIVWGISRQQEFIVLRIDGFMPTNFQTCNIIFVVQEHRYAPLWRSIDSTARSLNGLADGLWTRRPNAHRDSSSGSALSHPVPRPDSCSSPWLRQMLFPEECHAKMQSILSRGDFGVEWFDSQTNFEQRKAVDAVVTANYGSVPYLISGPPGTGKTKTIVETALQLLQRPTSGLTPHLLVCAPSDPAADTLANRLSGHLDPKSLFRLNGWTRSFAEVPGNLLLYSKIENNLFSLPDFETMMSYKIVVTTCRDADMLVQARLTNKALAYQAKTTLSAIAPEASNSIDSSQLIHWTALLLDEAAQAIEPEALIPLSVVDPAFSLVADGVKSTEWSLPAPQFVMAGDEYQLGPRLSLKSASPLSTSLFARLFARPLYHAHPLSRANGSKPLTSTMLPMLRPMFTNLIRNYRSHPAILTVPSTLFYTDTLVAECTTLSEAVRTWPGWRVRPNHAEDFVSGKSACWPVLFINNSGSDALESVLAGNGTGAGGLFNASEATTALRVVKSLISHTPPLPAKHTDDGLSEALPRIQPREIVVMTPFEAQVKYLRTTFRETGLYDVNIGPLEAFQGLESRIVVLCTTRTRLGSDDQGRDRFVREDRAKGFGVIGQPKEFNVAITRAKEGLIVIGNKECLVCTGDEAWAEFLAFCERNGRSHERLPAGLVQRQGRLERALRYAEDLARKGDEVGDGVDGISGRPPTGFGYPERQKSSSHRLRGNMPSLDEDMYREGMKTADGMRENYEVDEGATGDGGYDELGYHGNGYEWTPQSSVEHIRNAQVLPAAHGRIGLSTEGPISQKKPLLNGRSSMPITQLPPNLVPTPSDALIDLTNTPPKRNSEELSGSQVGSSKLPLPTSTENNIAQEMEKLDLRGKKKSEEFDRDPEAEYERADCTTQ